MKFRRYLAIYQISLRLNLKWKHQLESTFLSQKSWPKKKHYCSNKLKRCDDCYYVLCFYFQSIYSFSKRLDQNKMSDYLSNKLFSSLKRCSIIASQIFELQSKLNFLLTLFSTIIMRKVTKVFRQSTTFCSPENYVTIEIRNKNINKKLSHHRSSVLNQLRATQSILNESLIKSSKHTKSAFMTPKHSNFSLRKEMQKSSFSNLLSVKKKKFKQKRRKDGNFQNKFFVGEQIKSKLMQITNISHHFDQACVHKTKKLKTQSYEVYNNYLLPTLDQHRVNQQATNPVEDTKITKNWLKKLRNGRSLAQKLKKRLSNVKFSLPLRQKINEENRVDCQQKQRADNNQNQSEGEGHIIKRPLKDVYFTRLERKTAPTSQRKNTFYKMFCSNKETGEPTLRDDIQIESEEVRKLQQFVSGTESSEFKEYDDLINIKGFIKDKQNFDVLNRMYSFVKQKYAYDFKEMNLESIKESNLLALVYYLQNQNNMSELEKKHWKAKMRFIE